MVHPGVRSEKVNYICPSAFQQTLLAFALTISTFPMNKYDRDAMSRATPSSICERGGAAHRIINISSGRFDTSLPKLIELKLQMTMSFLFCLFCCCSCPHDWASLTIIALLLPMCVVHDMTTTTIAILAGDPDNTTYKPQTLASALVWLVVPAMWTSGQAAVKVQPASIR